MYQEDGPGAQKTVRRLLDVFKRHKILVLLPIVIALEVSVPLALKRPHQYVGATRLWIDTAAPNRSSTDPTQTLNETPSHSGQSTLQEHIALSSFRVAVGRRSPLASRLTAQGTPAARLDDKIDATLLSAFSVGIVGPQVLEISMTSKDASIIPGTLRALVSQYRDDLKKENDLSQQGQLKYYQDQIKAQQKPLDDARAAVNGYLADHPTASVPTDINNPGFLDLWGRQTAAQNVMTGLQNSAIAADTALKNSASQQIFHYKDEPGAVVKLSQKKKIISTGVAGLFGGLLVSALVLALLAATDRGARRREDIEDELGLEVVATVGDYPQSPARRRNIS